MPDAAKELEVNGRVVEQMPNALFRVELENESRSEVTAHLSGGASGILRVLPGDGVVVALMPYDMTRGRIVRRRS